MSVVLVLGSPASAPADDAHGVAHDVAHGVAPLSHGAQAQSPAPASTSPDEAAAPLRAHFSEPRSPPATWMPVDGVAPLNMRGLAPGGPPRPDEGADPRAPAQVVSPQVVSPKIIAPFGSGPSLTPDRPDPRALRAVRLELLVGPVWRIRTAETLFLASLEAGRLQGFSGTFHAGMFVAPDRDFVGVTDFPIGGGFVARRRLGRRSLFGSIGFTAGILVHRAATDLGVIRRVDPDFQLPLRFGWTAGRVGLSVALLQGFSVRTRTYSRRGVEVWERIPYRVGFAVGLHFDVGVRRAKPPRFARHRR